MPTNPIIFFERQKYIFSDKKEQNTTQEESVIFLNTENNSEQEGPKNLLSSLESFDSGNKIFYWGRNFLIPKDFVGVIKIEETSIQILPKFFLNQSLDQIDIIKKNIATMLEYCDISIFETGIANIKSLHSMDEILSIFIRLFAKELLKLLQRTSHKTYLIQEKELPFVREKIIFKNLYNPARKHIIPCQFHERSENTLISKTLRYSTGLMITKLRNSHAKEKKTIQNLQWIYDILGDVDTTPVSLHNVQSIRFDRVSIHFRPYIRFCECFLSKENLVFNSGTNEFFSFLVPMEKIFEQFISGLIKIHLTTKIGIDTNHISCQKKLWNLASFTHNNRFGLTPDVFLDYPSGPIIIDTKYKFLNPNDPLKTIDMKDIYQMFAYGAKSKAKGMILLYPSYYNQNSHYPIISENGMIHYSDQNTSLNIRTINFEGDYTRIEFIEKLGSDLAKFINELRESKA